jgi:methyl-accepting chemotaxis protein
VPKDLSKRREQQAASLEQTAAALDEITVNVTNAAKRADEARHAAATASDNAERSGKVVADAIGAMSRIENSSNQISNIIGVIDEIASQGKPCGPSREAITSSAKEQAIGLSEVNSAVNQMDQVTQQNAAMVEETNAASATLLRKRRVCVNRSKAFSSDRRPAERQVNDWPSRAPTTNPSHHRRAV